MIELVRKKTGCFFVKKRKFAFDKKGFPFTKTPSLSSGVYAIIVLSLLQGSFAYMIVYIEYALIENFLYDYVLLSLSFWASREKTKWYKLAFSALCGAIFALVCPFITLPSVLFLCVKIGVGLLLCILSFGRLKTKKEWGRYAFTALCFFFLTFGFGGAMQSFSGKKALPPPAVFIGFVLLSLSVAVLIRKLYEKRALHAFIYPCTLVFGQNNVRALGYYDSGNKATKNGVPICFISPELSYELLGEEWLKGGGTVCDEAEIITVSGGKKIAIFKGEIAVETSRGKIEKNGVYFSPSKNMITREYKVLLHAATVGE